MKNKAAVCSRTPAPISVTKTETVLTVLFYHNRKNLPCRAGANGSQTGLDMTARFLQLTGSVLPSIQPQPLVSSFTTYVDQISKKMFSGVVGRGLKILDACIFPLHIPPPVEYFRRGFARTPLPRCFARLEGEMNMRPNHRIESSIHRIHPYPYCIRLLTMIQRILIARCNKLPLVTQEKKALSSSHRQGFWCVAHSCHLNVLISSQRSSNDSSVVVRN
jgi:hypothetical protein